ncbi:hemolysin family protein [Phycicoccus sp. MAQZ13P-2]|uniref:hemolysin family protein n=1 Tax=Phycicoccus mangrovi TaxID=2840470 RepID=UPI001C0058BB|nr:hemolysin family protein [Phycicoccus mangrovi]MBT9257222.1 hemolysin family protein [Phycicoccus mangrovi]MBT9276159.1 hemolysin family protein [Phycicoccus mangrovi]
MPAVLGDIALVVVFVLVGGVFAGTELALVSLRESQLVQLERQGGRGAKVASVARNPNRFLAAVQIGVTFAGFLSAAFGASTISPYLTPVLEGWGLPEGAAATVSLVGLTVAIAYVSLVLGELVPKRIALQRSTAVALLVAPAVDRFAALMRPVIRLLSVSTDGVVRLLGLDPKASGEEISEEELQHLVTSTDAIPADRRAVLSEVFSASQHTMTEVMTPRHEVAFLDADLGLAEAVAEVAGRPHSRYPVIGSDFDDVLGFVHVRDLHEASGGDARTVRDVTRPIVALPGTNRLLPSLTTLRHERAHIAVVVDEYGGTDGIVTLEDLVEELVGEIWDERDVVPREAVDPDGEVLDARSTLEEFAERTGVELPDTGAYETVGGFVLAQLGRVAVAGDRVPVQDRVIEVLDVDGHRIGRVRLLRPT